MLNQYYSDYLMVAGFMLVGVLLVGAAVMTSRVIAPRAPGGLKDVAYESGMEPIGDEWNQSHIRYYIFALVFLVFAVEAVFLFPWAIQLEYFDSIGKGLQNLVKMFIFLFVLLLGLLDALRKGVLKWE